MALEKLSQYFSIANILKSKSKVAKERIKNYKKDD